MNRNICDNIMRAVTIYFERMDIGQIAHTQSVAMYTKFICMRKGMTEDEIALHEASAWLHDIGCPEAQRLCGNTLPVNQMKYGRSVTEELLACFSELSAEESAWLCDVVGSHHLAEKVDELGFWPLFEADVIVNVCEGYYNEKQAMAMEKYFKSEVGKKLLSAMCEYKNK